MAPTTLQTTISELLRTSETQYRAAEEQHFEGNFQPAVQSARKAAETLVRSVGSSENLRAALHKVPETPLVSAAWEKAFWKLHPRQQRYELVFAKANAVLEKRAREIYSTLFLLDKGSEAHASRQFSSAATLTFEATRRAVDQSPEQKRAAFMWSLYARELCPHDKATEVFMAQKIPALAPFIDGVARHETHRVNDRSRNTNNDCFMNPVRRLGARLLALADRLIPTG